MNVRKLSKSELKIFVLTQILSFYAKNEKNRLLIESSILPSRIFTPPSLEYYRVMTREQYHRFTFWSGVL
jgi:hypothetical protein